MRSRRTKTTQKKDKNTSNKESQQKRDQQKKPASRKAKSSSKPSSQRSRRQSQNQKPKSTKQTAQSSQKKQKQASVKPQPQKTHTRMVFAREAGYEMAGIVQDKQFSDFWIQEERAVDYGQSGNIYKGKVSRVLPSLNAAFVDIGLEKDGFLSFADLVPDFHLASKKQLSKRITSIDEVVKQGDEILLQMQKEAIGEKGPSMTRKISIPGRFLVYMPGADTVRMSRMLSDNEKRRFRKIVDKEFDLEGGLIFRTASKGKTADQIERDLNYLKRAWRRVQNEYEFSEPPKLIHKELDLFERVLRDDFSSDINEIVIDHPRLKYRVSQFLKVIAPDVDSDSLIHFHTERDSSIWKSYELSGDLDRLFSKKIHLDCGGYIIIEEMETLTAIDVNSGKNIAGKSLDETIFETNLEAAIEVPRQLRLRQIGGIIIVDFIDMRLKRHREKVFRTLNEELGKDRTPSDIQEFTDLGLIQITRQRSGQSLTSQLTYECPHCQGRGRRPTFSFD